MTKTLPRLWAATGTVAAVSILVNPYSNPDQWMASLSALLPDDDLILWDKTAEPDLDPVEFVIAGRFRPSVMARLGGLRAVLSLAAGAEQWQTVEMTAALARSDGDSVPVVRLHDPAMSNEMAAYALHWVTHFHRGFDQMADLQAQRRFETPPYVEAYQYPVGVLGYGSIGARVGEAFADLGYPVNAWSRSGGEDVDTPTRQITHYQGLDRLDAFLAESRAVINVLPSTPATTGLLTAERLGLVPEGAVLVNMGRGTVVDEAVLLSALDDGPLAVAVLDVTDPEPPPADSPLYGHPGVILTGHCAGSTLVGSASRLIVANIERIRRGEAPFPLLDLARGY